MDPQPMTTPRTQHSSMRDRSISGAPRTRVIAIATHVNLTNRRLSLIRRSAIHTGLSILPVVSPFKSSRTWLALSVFMCAGKLRLSSLRRHLRISSQPRPDTGSVAPKTQTP